jgi:MTH538 TIR-like domain (DUF1863)
VRAPSAGAGSIRSGPVSILDIIKATRKKKRVFFSFIAEDRKSVDGLRLLAANESFDIEFYDESVKTPYDSLNAAYIKTKIREKIDRASVTVCLISKETHLSQWVDWELEYSDKRGKTMIAMALRGVDSAILPKLIKEKQLTFHPWNHDRLYQLISQA